MASEPQLQRYTFQIRNEEVATTLSVYGSGELSVGRASDNSLVIKHESVSRHHTRLCVLPNCLSVFDLHSPNGTFVGGQRLISGGGQDADRHAEIGIGPAVVIRLQEVQPAAAWRRILPTGLVNGPRSTQWGMAAAAGVVVVLVGLALLLSATEQQLAAPAAGRALGHATLIPTFTPMPGVSGVVVQSEATAGGTDYVAALPTVAQYVPTPVPPPAPPAPPPALPAAPEAAVQTGQEAASVPSGGSSLADAAAVPEPARAKPADLEWDSRLDALGVTVERTNAAGTYWRLVRALWQDEQQAGGTHNIYVDVLDEAGRRLIGQPVTVLWADGKSTGNTDTKPEAEYPFNFPMYAAGTAYSVRVEGLPSDIVHGAGMGSIEARTKGIHSSYLFTFQRTTQ